MNDSLLLGHKCENLKKFKFLDFCLIRKANNIGKVTILNQGC